MIDEEIVPLDIWLPLRLFDTPLSPMEFQRTLENFVEEQFPVFLSQHFAAHSPVPSLTIMLSQSEFFKNLAEGEWLQQECLYAIQDAFSSENIAVFSFGAAPTSAKTAAHWGIDNHHDHAKPLISYMGKSLVAPDMVMRLNDQPYALEVKGKNVHASYKNVLLNESEVQELEEASKALGMPVLFVFRLYGHQQPDRIELGDYDQRPDLSPFIA